MTASRVNIVNFCWLTESTREAAGVRLWSIPYGRKLRLHADIRQVEGRTEKEYTFWMVVMEINLQSTQGQQFTVSMIGQSWSMSMSDPEG